MKAAEDHAINAGQILRKWKKQRSLNSVLAAPFPSWMGRNIAGYAVCISILLPAAVTAPVVDTKFTRRRFSALTAAVKLEGGLTHHTLESGQTHIMRVILTQSILRQQIRHVLKVGRLLMMADIPILDEGIQ